MTQGGCGTGLLVLVVLAPLWDAGSLQAQSFGGLQAARLVPTTTALRFPSSALFTAKDSNSDQRALNGDRDLPRAWVPGTAPTPVVPFGGLPSASGQLEERVQRAGAGDSGERETGARRRALEDAAAVLRGTLDMDSEDAEGGDAAILLAEKIQAAVEAETPGAPLGDLASDLEDALRYYRNLGFLPGDLRTMVQTLPALATWRSARRSGEVVQLLTRMLALRRYDLRRLSRALPAFLLRSTGDIEAFFNALAQYGLQGKSLVLTLIRWPALLLQDEQSIGRLAAALTGPEVGISPELLSPLLRQAPWLLAVDVESQIVPVVDFLRSRGVVDLPVVLRAFPQVLNLDIRDELTPRLAFLADQVGLDNVEDIPVVVQSFPIILDLDVASRMVPVVQYLEDLEISRLDIARIIRSFPSLLGLDPEVHFEPSVTFLRSIGVKNVARFVRRLPPVLGYDVETNIMPKYKFLTQELQLSAYDVTRFPAYFSYPLDTVIMPRMKYLQQLNKRDQFFELTRILTPGDATFATRVARTSKSSYRTFKEAFVLNQRRRAQQRQAQRTEETAAAAAAAATEDAAPQAGPLAPSPVSTEAQDFPGRSGTTAPPDPTVASTPRDAPGTPPEPGPADRAPVGQQGSIGFPREALVLDLRPQAAASDQPLGGEGTVLLLPINSSALAAVSSSPSLPETGASGVSDDQESRAKLPSVLSLNEVSAQRLEDLVREAAPSLDTPVILVGRAALLARQVLTRAGYGRIITYETLTPPSSSPRRPAEVVAESEGTTPPDVSLNLVEDSNDKTGSVSSKPAGAAPPTMEEPSLDSGPGCWGGTAPASASAME